MYWRKTTMQSSYEEDILSRVRAKNSQREDRVFSIGTVNEIVEILSGRIRRTPAKMVKLGVEITLVLSSKGDGYYRTTPDSCTCKGWHYSIQKYGVGKCRHHTEAFPEEAKENAEILQRLTSPRKLAQPPEEKSILGDLPSFKPFLEMPVRGSA
jgi:hypothetical protein